jgi:DNA-binding Lrp family transcriptional regulator
MDATDLLILSSLQHDVRQTNRDLAAQVGLSPSACLSRVKALTDAGVIRGARAEVDLAALGRPTQAMVSLKIRPQAFSSAETFQGWLGEQRETLAVFMVSGGADFLVHVAVPDTDALRVFVLGLAKRSEIADIRTSIVFSHSRSVAVDPMLPST